MQKPIVKTGLSIVATIVGVVGISIGSLLLVNGGHQTSTAASSSLPSPLSSSPAASASATANPASGSWNPTVEQLGIVSQIASGMASANGDPAAVSATWIGTTRAAYLAALGEGSVSDGSASDPVIVVVLSGHFVATSALVPKGESEPQGVALDIAWDSRTARVTDWGIDDAVPTLAPLGEAHAFQLQVIGPTP